MSITVTYLPQRLEPDPARLITRFFSPADTNRARGIVERILQIPESDIPGLLSRVQSTFRSRHQNLDEVLEEHYDAVGGLVETNAKISDHRRLLIGAYFTMEYAIEATALFNPSIVPAVDQLGVPPGSKRFLMSLRATGEGHVSSIVFRRGLIDANGNVEIEPAGLQSRSLKAIVASSFEKASFERDLEAMGAMNQRSRAILAALDDPFTVDQLSHAIADYQARHDVSGSGEESNDTLMSLTQANYRLRLPSAGDVASIVIFPFSYNERHGIEDLRLVHFSDEGTNRYFGTFTAYNGARVFPQLLEYHFGEYVDIHMLTGRCARNKGMALFPRKINGKYAMIARLDNENLYFAQSNDILNWNFATLFEGPAFPWELFQTGNCGSPLETDAGWLLLTHGVGPMREYCIGASLLDLEDPSRVIGRTREPFLVPREGQRVGYVPNVVYSCGGMIHDRFVILPYAINDTATCFARLDLHELIESLRANPVGA